MGLETKSSGWEGTHLYVDVASVSGDLNQHVASWYCQRMAFWKCKQEHINSESTIDGKIFSSRPFPVRTFIFAFGYVRISWFASQPPRQTHHWHAMSWRNYWIFYHKENLGHADENSFKLWLYATNVSCEKSLCVPPSSNTKWVKRWWNNEDAFYHDSGSERDIWTPKSVPALPWNAYFYYQYLTNTWSVSCFGSKASTSWNNTWPSSLDSKCLTFSPYENINLIIFCQISVCFNSNRVYLRAQCISKGYRCDTLVRNLVSNEFSFIMRRQITLASGPDKTAHIAINHRSAPPSVMSGPNFLAMLLTLFVRI